jgi:hypothetical protein
MPRPRACPLGLREPTPLRRRLRRVLVRLLFLLAAAAPSAPAPAAECQDGAVTSGAFTFPCWNVDLLAWLPVAGVPTFASDVWGWTDPVTGKPYAILGLSDGVAFVELADPENPVLLGTLATATTTSFWADVKVAGNHAYVVKDFAGAHGVQVFDLTQLRQVASPPVRFAATSHYTEVSNVHNLAANEETGFVYAVGSTIDVPGGSTCNGGLHAIDVSTPASPRFAGCFADDGYTHDAQCVVYAGPDAEHRGREVCFAANSGASPGAAGGFQAAHAEHPQDGEGGRLTIVDVADKAAPRLLARVPYPDAAFAHQGWLTEDHRYFLLGDELDELTFGHGTRTLVFDVSDLDAPVLVGDHRSELASTDHNLYVVGEHVFQANYSSGLRILRLVDPAGARLEEVASFDTFPPDDGVGYGVGAWSVYPFFEQGFVVVSDILLGLFVLQPRLAQEPLPLELAVPSRIHPGSRGVVPVALLAGGSFEPTGVDVATLAFGPAHAPPAHALDDPAVFAEHVEDANGDGALDLVLHFRVPATGIRPGDREACLTARTTGGRELRGCAPIETVPARRCGAGVELALLLPWLARRRRAPRPPGSARGGPVSPHPSARA